MKQLTKTDLISYIVITLCVGIFIGFILTMVYVKSIFSREIIVKVQPMGWLHYPYKPNNLYFTTLPEELHKVKIKNGNVVDVERLRYAYQEDK